MKNGYGIYQDENGSFEGNFVDNARNGNGNLILNDGKRFDGVWVNGNMTGPGKFCILNEVEKRYKLIYKGNFKNLLYSGEGEIHYENGDKYKGTFKKGKKHGQGLMKYKDGE
mmetsp:Transcript_20794/g.20687  ORF Transcript_20794/g.20687 Transcript_20794/m.20687 type:complete len:112 (-) Transcript_20794:655-990(-)